MAEKTLNTHNNLTADDLISIGTKENTAKSYQGDVNHFINSYRGLLPASTVSIEQYLTAYQQTLSPGTLARRLSGLSKWHTQNNFPDPTNDPRVKELLRGIKQRYARPKIKAHPLVASEICRIVEHINAQLAIDHKQENSQQSVKRIKLLRDKAMLLLMFWRGFRASALCSISIEQIDSSKQNEWVFHIPPDKTHDVYWEAKLYRVTNPKYVLIDPIKALSEYIAERGIQSGPLFSKISRAGNLQENHMKPNSLNTWIKVIAEEAGIAAGTNRSVSTHSCRMGFATSFGRDIGVIALMKYIDWRDANTAIGYVNSLGLEQELQFITCAHS